MIKRRVKKLQTKVSDKVVEKAADLNPLVPKVEMPSLENVPRITNENITEHREEVLSGARKYIYPLQLSKHRIVLITLAIITGAVIGFFIYCSAALYHYYQYNTFLYRVTQVVPFPVAKVGGSYVDYENYLFRLRQRVHYYETQQQQHFTKKDSQLIKYETESLNDVINDTYVKKLAAQNKVSVSDKEVNDRLSEVRQQNRLGSSEKVFSDVLRDYFGWSIDDYKRALKDQILSEKVVATLDVAANQRAQAAISQLKGGANFGAVAKQISDDASTKANGGDYGGAITKENPNVPPEVIQALFSLKPGQYSSVIDAGNTLEIVKLNSISGNSVNAQHISINLQSSSVYLNQIKAEQPARTYIHF